MVLPAQLGPLQLVFEQELGLLPVPLAWAPLERALLLLGRLQLVLPSPLLNQVTFS